MGGALSSNNAKYPHTMYEKGNNFQINNRLQIMEISLTFSSCLKRSILFWNILFTPESSEKFKYAPEYLRSKFLIYFKEKFLHILLVSLSIFFNLYSNSILNSYVFVNKFKTLNPVNCTMLSFNVKSLFKSKCSYC